MQNSIKDEMTERLVAMAKTAKIGDPMSPDTNIGPVTTVPQYQKILDYIDIAKSEGACLLAGGGPSDVGPQFVQPTIFTDVNNAWKTVSEIRSEPLSNSGAKRLNQGCLWSAHRLRIDGDDAVGAEHQEEDQHQ